MKKIFFIAALLLAGLSNNVQAQEFKTDESIRSQVINNRVPNATYAPTNTAPIVNKDKGFVGSSLAKEIRDSETNIKTPIAPTTPTPAKALGLASEVGEREAKAISDKTKQEPKTLPVVPTQEEKKN